MACIWLRKKIQASKTIIYATLIKRKLKLMGVGVSYEFSIFINGGKNISIGKGGRFSRFVQMNARDCEIKIGEHFSIDVNSQIDAEGQGLIYIGDSVLIESNVVLRSSNHRFSKGVKIKDQGHQPGTIYIGDNVWIGSN